MGHMGPFQIKFRDLHYDKLLSLTDVCKTNANIISIFVDYWFGRFGVSSISWFIDLSARACLN